MKRLFTLAGFVCLVAMLLPACAPAPEPEPEPAPAPASEPAFDQAAEEAAIRSWWKQRLASFNRHDVEAIAAQVDETYENWEATEKGRAAYKKSRSEWLEIAKDVQIKILDDIGMVFVTPDVAIYKYRFEMTDNVDSDGNPLPPQKLLAARVFVKKNGQWLYVAPFTRPIEE